MKITSLYTMHDVDDAKLAQVVAQMRDLGSPTIRVVDCSDYYVALEGVHRLAAAAATRTPVTFEILDQDDLIDSDSLDWQDLQPDELYSAGELAAEAYHPGSGIYSINDDDTVRCIRPAPRHF